MSKIPQWRKVHWRTYVRVIKAGLQASRSEIWFGKLTTWERYHIYQFHQNTLSSLYSGRQSPITTQAGIYLLKINNRNTQGVKYVQSSYVPFIPKILLEVPQGYKLQNCHVLKINQIFHFDFISAPGHFTEFVQNIYIVNYTHISAIHSFIVFIILKVH